MKEITGSRMGNLKMGIFVLVVLALSISLVLPPVSTQGEDKQELDFNECINNNSRGYDEPEVWYIYTTKQIIENITFELPVVINSSGELRITNFATMELGQNYDHQRNITIKDNGTLCLRRGTFKSNFAINIFLENSGKIILEQQSDLLISRITAKDNSKIQLSDSTISPGRGGLSITMAGDSTIDLTDSVISNAEEFISMDNSNIKLKNSNIDTKKYAISCGKIELDSNPNFRDMTINSCEFLRITDSKVIGLEIDKCSNLFSYHNTSIKDSTINSVGIGKLSSASIQNLKIDSIDNLELLACNVNILKIDQMVTNLIIKDSEISQLDIENCKKLETHGTHFDNSKLRNSLDEVIFHSSEVEHCSIFPLVIKIYDSTVIGNEDELNDLTRGINLEAYNSTFNAPLHFTGTTEAHLINCSTKGEIPPKVIVDEEAVIRIYWWLEVMVLDNHSLPLSNVMVTICDFITNAPKDEGISDQNGKVKFALLANTISKSGWNTRNNKSYFVKGYYNGHTKSNETGIWMRDNTKSYLEFYDVKEEPAPKESIFTFETITGILIFIVIIFLVMFSLVVGKSDKKKSSSNRIKNNNRPKKKDNGPRINGSNNNGLRQYPDFDDPYPPPPEPSHPRPRPNPRARTQGPRNRTRITINRRLKRPPRGPGAQRNFNNNFML